MTWTPQGAGSQWSWSQEHGAVVLGWYANDIWRYEYHMNMTWTWHEHLHYWLRWISILYINLWLLPNQLVATESIFYRYIFEMTVHLWKPEDGHKSWPQHSNFSPNKPAVEHWEGKSCGGKNVFLTPSLGAPIENTTIALHITHITQESYPSRPSSSNPRESTWQSSDLKNSRWHCCVFMCVLGICLKHNGIKDTWSCDSQLDVDSKSGSSSSLRRHRGCEPATMSEATS